MENENVDVQEGVTQEEQSPEIDNELLALLQQEESDQVSISKADLSKIKRKAIAYDSLKQKAKEVKPEEPNSKQSSQLNEDVRAELAKIRLEAKGYSDSEIKFIQKFGGLEEVEKTPEFKIALEAMQAQKKAEEALATGGNGSSTYSKYSEDDFDSMSAEDLKKLI